MRFHVAQQLRQPVGTQTSFDLRERQLFLDDDAVLSDLAGSVTLLRTDRGLLVTVHAVCTIRETCSRCLADTDCPINIDFQEEYIPVLDPFTGVPVRLAQAADYFRIGPDFVLDLAEGLRQYKVMAEPLKPLCRPDCQGLCPDCGANLNEGPCGCRPQMDSRWQALAALKIVSDEGS